MATCAGPGCTATVPDHKWGRIKQGADWFFSWETGEAFCPAHIPAWVEAWRIEKRYEACLEYELEEDDE